MKLLELEKIIKEISDKQENEQIIIFKKYKNQFDDLKLLIMPGSKENWGIAAKIIKWIGPSKYEPFILDLLIWLQDINWPGAYEIIDVIKNMNIDVVINSVEITLIKAKSENDYMWIGGINMLIKKMNIKKEQFNNKNNYDILELSDF